MAHVLGWIWCWVCFGSSISALCWALFTSALVVLSRIDLQHMLLPDAITLPLLWLGLMFSDMGYTLGNLSQSMWGAVWGYSLFFGMNVAYRRIRGIDGLGLGDAKLMAALLAWLGWQTIQPLILLACSSALLTTLMLHMMHKKPELRIPFGPHLALAGAAMMKFG